MNRLKGIYIRDFSPLLCCSETHYEKILKQINRSLLGEGLKHFWDVSVQTTDLMVNVECLTTGPGRSLGNNGPGARHIIISLRLQTYRGGPLVNLCYCMEYL